MLLNGQWQNPIPILVDWILNDAGYNVFTIIPANVQDSLPTVVLSGAPSGGIYGYTRDVSVDIDVYAIDWSTMAQATSEIDASIFRLAGNGNDYGYVDTTQITSWTSRDCDFNPNILRCTATVSLSLRPQ